MGTFTYQVAEIDLGQTGYIYDDTICEVVVSVTDAGGELALAWTVDEEEVDVLLFNNEYAPRSVALDLEVEKRITGTPIMDEDFDFILGG